MLGYGKKQELFNITANLQNAQLTSSDPKIIGYRLSDDEKDFVVLSRVDGILVSQIKKYTDFDSLMKELNTIIGSNSFARFSYSRVACRFINEFNLPVNENPRNYFNLFISLPSGFPEKLQRVKIETECQSADNENLSSIIKLTVSVKSNEYSTILDTDSHIDLRESVDFLKLKPYFNDIRNFKNQIFFNSLTPLSLNFFS